MGIYQLHSWQQEIDQKLWLCFSKFVYDCSFKTSYKVVWWSVDPPKADANRKGSWFHLQTEKVEEKISALYLFPEPLKLLPRSTMANSISWLPANKTSLLKCLVDKVSFPGTQGRNLFRQEIRQGFVHVDRNLSGFSQLLDPSWTASSSSWSSECKTGSSLEVLSHHLAWQLAPSSGNFLCPDKLSAWRCRGCPSSCSTAFHCCWQQRLAWLLGEHIVSSMLMYTPSSLLIPSSIVSLVVEGKEMAAFQGLQLLFNFDSLRIKPGRLSWISENGSHGWNLNCVFAPSLAMEIKRMERNWWNFNGADQAMVCLYI